MKDQRIEMDCAPGGPRPGDLLPGLLEGTGLKPKKPSGMFFGNWRWGYRVPDSEAKRVKALIKRRITKMYERGTIRYGAW